GSRACYPPVVETMTSVRIEAEASAELTEAAMWYERKRAGLGLEFLEAVHAAIEFITHFPQAGSSVPRIPKEQQIRRVPVQRFPFHVVYLERSDAIRVLAFAHDRRSPGYWRARI